MAVGIPDEGRVVVGVVLGEDPRRVQHLGADVHGGAVEGVHLLAAAGPEGDVELTILGPLGRASQKEPGSGPKNPTAAPSR